MPSSNTLHDGSGPAGAGVATRSGAIVAGGGGPAMTRTGAGAAHGGPPGPGERGLASSLAYRAQCYLGRRILNWLLSRIRIGGLTVRYAFSGETHHFGDRDSPTQGDLTIKDPHLPWEMITLSQLGLGMGYVLGTWESSSPYHMLLVLTLNERQFRKVVMKGYRFDLRALRTARTALREIENSRRIEDCRRQIGLAYDVGNDFYRLMIGPTLVYSCGIWPRPDATLDEAQLYKIDVIIDKLQIEPSHRVLDIGSGWGTLCARVHERTGATVRGIALSHEQVNGARERFPDLDFEYMDWREERGRYDRIVTVGMIEHVGLANLGAFMQQVATLLAPGGLCVVHCLQPIENVLISERHESHPSWGSVMLPGVESPTQSEVVMAAIGTGALRLIHGENFGIHYARTMRAWLANMHLHREALLELVSPEVFRSHEYAWHLSCALESGYNLMQMVFEKQPFGTPLEHSAVDPARIRARALGAG